MVLQPRTIITIKYISTIIILFAQPASNTRHCRNHSRMQYNYSSQSNSEDVDKYLARPFDDDDNVKCHSKLSQPQPPTEENCAGKSRPPQQFVIREKMQRSIN